MRTAALIALATVTACSTSSASDDVHPAIVDMVNTLESEGDCVGLQAAFDRSDDADELRYIDDALRSAGCYD